MTNAKLRMLLGKVNEDYLELVEERKNKFEEKGKENNSDKNREHSGFRMESSDQRSKKSDEQLGEIG